MKVRVTKNKGEVPDLPGAIRQVGGYLAAARNGQYEISVTPVISRRTSSKSLLAVWCSHIAASCGLDQREVIRFFQTKFNGERYCIGGSLPETIPGDDVDAAMLAKVKQFAFSELGMTLPEPEDQYYSTLKNIYE